MCSSNKSSIKGALSVYFVINAQLESTHVARIVAIRPQRCRLARLGRGAAYPRRELGHSESRQWHMAHPHHALPGVCVLVWWRQIRRVPPKGMLSLGLCIHVARSIVLFVVFPTLPTATASKLALLAWAVTEVMRYPMFLAPHSKHPPAYALPAHRW